jgi:tetratricopeptide (TPR) repeat protein
MLPRRLLLPLLLALAVPVSGRAAPPAAGPGSHQRWEESRQAASAALARGDLAAASTAMLAALDEAMSFAESDPRLARTFETLEPVLRALHGSGGVPAVDGLLAEMEQRAAAAGPRAAFLEVDAKRRRAGLAVEQGQHAKGEQLAGEALARAEQQLGPEHPLTLQARVNLVRAISARDPQRGVATAEADLAAARSRFGAGSPSVGQSLVALAVAEQLAGWPERGIAPAEEGLAIQEGLGGPDLRTALATRMLLAELKVAVGRVADGVDAAEHLRPLLAALPDAPRHLLQLDTFVASAWIHAGELQRAVEALGRARQHARALPPEATEHTHLLGLESAVEEQRGRLDEAAAPLERALEFETSHGRAKGRNAAAVRLALARIESRRGHTDEAAELITPVMRGDVSDVQLRAGALNGLAYVYATAGMAEDALPLAERALALLEERLGAGNPGLASVLDTVARAQLELGRLTEAAATFERVRAALAQRPGSVAAEREAWSNQALLAKRLGDEPGLARAEAEIERRDALLSREVRAPKRTSDGVAEVENEKQNFRFRPPGPEWVPFDASRMNPLASLGYVRRDPMAFLMVASENTGSASMGLDALASIVAAGFGEGFTLRSKEPRTIGDLEGVLLVLDGAVQGQHFRFATWITVQGAFVHQLSVWGPSANYDAGAIEALAVESFAGFAALDGDASPALGEPAERFRSKRYGYEVDLEDTAWRRAPLDFRHAEWAAKLGEHAGLVVVPVSLLGRELSLDALVVGLGATLEGFDPAAARPLEQGRSEGVEHEFTQQLGGVAYRFRARVLQRGSVGLLAAAWVIASTGEAGDAVLDAIERVELGRARPPDEIDELDDAERARHAFVFNEIGIHFVEQQRSLDALGWFELAVVLGPDDPTVLENDVYVLRGLGRYADALDRLAAAAELVERNPKLLATRAAVREELGRTDEALADYAKALDTGYSDADAEVRYAELLVAKGDHARALAFLNARIEAGAGPALRRQRARVTRLDGDTAGAVEELEQLLERNPTDVATMFELAESQEAAGDHAALIRTCDRILASGQPAPYAHYLKATAQVEQGDPAGAKASLEAALALEPESGAARELLEHVSAMLGQGDHSVLQTAIEPVEIPPQIRRVLSAAPAASPPDPAAPGMTLSLVKGIHFEAGRDLRTTVRWQVKVFDQRGVEQLSRLEFELHPLYEELHVNSLVVRDGEGRELARGEASDAYVLHLPDGEQVTSARRVYVPVRGLEPGATIDLVLTLREKGAPERFSYVEWQPAGGLPIARSLLFVTGDIERVRAHASAGLSSERGDGWLAFWADDRPAERWEPNQPQRRPDLPSVRLGDVRDEWEPLARAYLAEIASALAPSPALLETARAKLDGADSPDAKARALAQYVQGALHYQAIAFGRRARMPKAPAELMELRYGDCKDHSVLLHLLLEAAGVRSRLVLARFDAEIERAVPSLDQFDHMIVECLECREARFFDATDKSLALGGEVPRGLGGATVLLLDPESPRFEAIPPPTLAPHYASSERNVTVGLDGSVAVDEQIEFGGYPAAWVRDFLRGTDRAAWKDAVHRALAQTGDVIEEIEVEAFDATERPLRLRMRYAVRDGFSKSSSGWVGRTPMLWETELLRMDPVSQRSTPFELASPMRFRGSVRLVGPGGRPLVPPGEREVRHAGRFTALDGRIGEERDALVLHYEITRLAGDGPAHAYESARGETTQVFDFLRQPIETQPAP